MRAVFFLNACAVAALAQDPAASAQAACGPRGVRFDVRSEGPPNAVIQPEVEKALVHVIQDDGQVGCLGWGCTTTKVALDGSWVGANRANSHFSFAANPGERHLCVVWQSRFAVEPRMVGLIHFVAEAGKVYYFRTRVISGASHTFLDLDAIDSDEGRFLVAAYPSSISRPKK